MTSMKITWSVPYIPPGKEILTVPENDFFMTTAMRVRDTESTDLNHSTGAVIVKNGAILGKAANKAGFKNEKLIELHRKGWCVRKMLKVKSGTEYWLCPGCSNHKDHAESGAVRNALNKSGYDRVRGADLYLYGHYWCCKPCWDDMLRAGIRNVYVVENADKLFVRKGK